MNLKICLIKLESFYLLDSYPEIGGGNFKGALWIFKQWLALKIRVPCGISIFLLLTSSCQVFLGYIFWWTMVSALVNSWTFLCFRCKTIDVTRYCQSKINGFTSYLAIWVKICISIWGVHYELLNSSWASKIDLLHGKANLDTIYVPGIPGKIRVTRQISIRCCSFSVQIHWTKIFE